MWMEPPKGLVSSQKIAENRIKELLASDARILLTAYPFGNIRINNTVNSIEKEDGHYGHGYHGVDFHVPLRSTERTQNRAVPRN
jgi:Fe-S oxidoreductase